MPRSLRWFAAALCLSGLALVMAACAEAAPTLRPTEIVPTVAPPPTLNPEGDAAHGKLLFTTWRCDNCHGAQAGGRIGPNLAATKLTLVEFTGAIRETRPPKPAFSEAELSESDVRDVYVWLQNLDPVAAPASGADAPILPEGQILGMKLYTESGCDRCHGAFAQGSTDAPVLADYPDDSKTFLLAMSSTTEDVPEHNLEELDAGLMERLHKWLQEGANPDSGC